MSKIFHLASYVPRAGILSQHEVRLNTQKHFSKCAHCLLYLHVTFAIM